MMMSPVPGNIAQPVVVAPQQQFAPGMVQQPFVMNGGNNAFMNGVAPFAQMAPQQQFAPMTSFAPVQMGGGNMALGGFGGADPFGGLGAMPAGLGMTDPMGGLGALGGLGMADPMGGLGSLGIPGLTSQTMPQQQNPMMGGGNNMMMILFMLLLGGGSGGLGGLLGGLLGGGGGGLFGDDGGTTGGGRTGGRGGTATTGGGGRPATTGGGGGTVTTAGNGGATTVNGNGQTVTPGGNNNTVATNDRLVNGVNGNNNRNAANGIANNDNSNVLVTNINGDGNTVFNYFIADDKGNFKPLPPGTKPPVTPPHNGGHTGKVWGDPHYVGFQGDDFDIQDKGTFNVLSDNNLKVNVEHVPYPAIPGTTVMGKAGIQLGTDRILFDAKSQGPTLNGQLMELNRQYDLAAGSSVWNGSILKVDTPEYNMQFKDKGGYLDIDKFAIGKDGNRLDGVRPEGILGMTDDDTPGARKGKKGAGANGEGAFDPGVTHNDYRINDGDIFGNPNRTQFDTRLDQNAAAPAEQPPAAPVEAPAQQRVAEAPAEQTQAAAPAPAAAAPAENTTAPVEAPKTEAPAAPAAEPAPAAEAPKQPVAA